MSEEGVVNGGGDHVTKTKSEMSKAKRKANRDALRKAEQELEDRVEREVQRRVHRHLRTEQRNRKRKADGTKCNSVSKERKTKSSVSDEDTTKDEMFDSSEVARDTFCKIIHPVRPAKFFRDHWEKEHLLVKRNAQGYFSDWFSTQALDTILREEHVTFGENIDVVSYDEGKRETHNPPGRAYASVVWDYYQNGCSVRLLNPQSYSQPVWQKLSQLQEFFGCMAGANIYLTPAGSQGFAPHYDDIEAFVLQLEGKKHWRLYNPMNVNETLPRFSSRDIRPENLQPPILDVILEAGDLLYFPRGTIHQALTLPDTHSLHITVSCYQKNTWGDLMLKLMPQAVQQTIDNNIELRRGLPLNYLSTMGIANSDITNQHRREFIKKVHEMVDSLKSNLPLDSACDQMGVQLMHDCLPPCISSDEKARSVHGTGERWDGVAMRVTGQVELEPDTPIRLLRKSILRLVSEADGVKIHHCVSNSRTYHQKDPQLVSISDEMAPAVEFLIHKYPNFVTIDQLPQLDLTQKTELVTVLYDNGLIMTEYPLQPSDEDSSNDT